ncbi:UNVERIFIED_CONTAM: hypothetical protein FKN15_033781 [Acipenser sinensis]
MPDTEPRWSIFWTQAMALCPQNLSAFPDFMEEVRSFWDQLASGPSVLKQAAPLASLEGAEKLGLAVFPPVDSTIAALVKAPSAKEKRKIKHSNKTTKKRCCTQQRYPGRRYPHDPDLRPTLPAPSACYLSHTGLPKVSPLLLLMLCSLCRFSSGDLRPRSFPPALPHRLCFNGQA